VTANPDAVNEGIDALLEKTTTSGKLAGNRLILPESGRSRK
jgi:hypothetical protein